jgi:hypothetical protein
MLPLEVEANFSLHPIDSERNQTKAIYYVRISPFLGLDNVRHFYP